MELNEWNPVAGDNNASPPDGAPENMNYASVNNTLREGMAVHARHDRDTRGSLVAGGTADAITLTPEGTYTAYFDGMTFAFEASAANTGAVTIAVGGLSAVAVQENNGQALIAGQILSGSKYYIVYDDTTPRWVLVNPEPGAFAGNVVATGRISTEATDDVNLTDAIAPLRVGPAASGHLEMDGNELQAKSDATTAAQVNINLLGGPVVLGEEAANGDATLLRNEFTRVDASQTNTFRTRNTADGSPALGAAQSNIQRIERGDGELIAQLGFSASTDLVLESRNHGGPIVLRGEDTGGTARSLFRGDPDGSVELFHAGALAMQTFAGGVEGGQQRMRFDTHEETGFSVNLTTGLRNRVVWQDTNDSFGFVLNTGSFTTGDWFLLFDAQTGLVASLNWQLGVTVNSTSGVAFENLTASGNGPGGGLLINVGTDEWVFRRFG